MDEILKPAVKRIGVLTSGGDAPGMNAAIRAVVRAAEHWGIGCVGIRRGWNGLISGDVFQIEGKNVTASSTGAAQCSIPPVPTSS